MGKLATTKAEFASCLADVVEVDVGNMHLRVAPLMARDVAEWSDANRTAPESTKANLHLLALALVDSDGIRIFESVDEAGSLLTGKTYLAVWEVVSEIILQQNFPEPSVASDG